jgi:hypothetical protein
MVLHSDTLWQQQQQYDRDTARKTAADKRHRSSTAMTSPHDDADTTDITWVEMLALLQNNGNSDIKSVPSQPQQTLTRTTHIETTVRTTVAVTGGDSSTQQQLLSSSFRAPDDRQGSMSKTQLLSDVQQQQEYQYAASASAVCTTAAPFSGQELSTIAKQVCSYTLTKYACFE